MNVQTYMVKCSTCASRGNYDESDGITIWRDGRQLISTGALLALLLFMSFFDNFTQIPMIAPYASGLGANAVMTGWIVGIYSLTNSLGNIGAGIILDKFGRRIPLAIGLAWAGLGVWLYGFVGTPLGLLGARAFHGLGGSILVPAIFTMAADTLPSGKRGPGMGRIGAVIGLAAIIGPMVSGILRQAWGPRAVFTTVFVVMALGGLLALTLPETLSRTSATRKRRPKAFAFRSPPPRFKLPVQPDSASLSVLVHSPSCFHCKWSEPVWPQPVPEASSVFSRW